ncbi:peptidyl-tRNA hydrolase, mitochondrial isoform X1 [Ricinus communis]|uniref:peptidyl-tRNA hydrolase, mitochondrial isoform X1 n=1 Tax=Ricinus communis TaxID=3988 RepID=UPI00077248D0|nr:peptidyl-tRNA hydrolase, mitochondrial isoform X1 [Ricinus communis]XP_015582639.1 peptidyl-tRNA hydrolase, mitochondrial isoform X1 [Ricinus communis]|eukprot:XP_015582638.1 peptidyl-tRNA hydrolase, mitochondrial isoform X1 [Ricinus communis]
MLNKVCRRCFCTVASRPWLIVGLGNPGDKYKGTRHNVGFEMIDAFAQLLQIPMDKLHSKAIFGEGFVGEASVLLAKPQTYMNLSGESAGPLAAYYKLPLNRVIVLHDDMDLPCGVLRLQPKGGHGSHNGYGYVGRNLQKFVPRIRLYSYLQKMLRRGILEKCKLKSVIHHFRGNREFARLRIGIGRPPGQMDPKAFLLQKFNATAQKRIDTAIPEGAAALKSILFKGLTETARCFNQEQKYKHIRLQTMPT